MIMRAAVIRKYGVPAPEITTTWPKPVPGVNDLLVQVKAASVNPIDWKMMQGKIRALLPVKPPFVAGSDGAGIVAATGSGVTKFKVGDEVIFRPRKERIGTFAEFCLIHEDDAALKPKALSWEEAASLPLVALTAWQAFFVKANLKRGDRVLIHAGSGGVGSIAIQIAKSAGLYVATTCGASGAGLVRELGADQIIDYRSEDFSQKVRDMDAVLDTQGGMILRKSFDVVKPGGTVVTINGIPTPDVAERYDRGFLLKAIFHLANGKNRRLAKRRGINFRYLLMEADGGQLAKIAALADAKKIHAVVEKIFPLEKIAEAFALQQAGRVKGKVLLSI